MGIDPQLVDPENGDYSLQVDSPAIGYGCTSFSPEQVKNKRKQLSQKKYYKTNQKNIYVGGIINESTVWDADTVFVQDNVEISDGVNLGIVAGAKIIFQGYFTIDVFGSINAVGTANQRIVFTSQNHDDFALDVTTNGAWNGISFSNISADNQTSIFEYCDFSFSKKMQSWGGVIFVQNYSNIIVSNSLFYHNFSKYGGAIGIDYDSSPQISNSVFYQNYAQNQGSAIFCSYAYPVFINNTIVNNFVLSDDNYNQTGAIHCFISKPKLFNNIIRDNHTPYYQDIQMQEAKLYYTHNNNIENFSFENNNVDEPLDFSLENFMLPSGSICIDNGTLNLAEYYYLADTDFYGNPRIQNEAVDIGASEGFFDENSQDSERPQLNLTCFPNPFNPTITISFDMIENSNDFDFSIYNIKGQLINRLHNGFLEKGRHSFIWHGKNQLNQDVSSGVYFCRVQIDDRTFIRKVTLIK